VSAPGRAPIRVGGNEVRPGRRANLELPVARLSTGTYLSLPLTVVHGRRDGPRVWLSAAIHGDELNGLEIIRQVVSGLDARTLTGTVVAVPVVNVFGFVNQSRYLPDRRDLNRSFPGSPSGSLASRLAHLFMREVVAPSDAGVDLHTGSDDRYNLPHVRTDLEHERTSALADAFGAPVAVHSATRDGSLRQACTERGIPVLVFEGGQPNRFDDEVIEVGVAGIRRVLGSLAMISDPPRASRTKRMRRSRWVRARRAGIFRSAVTTGDAVTKGQTLGVVADVFGGQKAQVKASDDGIVIGRTLHPSVNQGDALVHIALP
jgi:predicted deacylase